MKKKSLKIKILLILLIIITLSAGIFVYQKKMSPTRIAFIKYASFTYGELLKANENNDSVKLELLAIKEGKRLDLSKYDIVFISTMGLYITDELEEDIQKGLDSGIELIMNDKYSTVSAKQRAIISKYFGNGTKTNYQNMLKYLRVHIDGKWGNKEIAEAVVLPNNYLYHYSKPERIFKSVKEYEEYYSTLPNYNPKAPKIVLAPFVIGRSLDGDGPVDTIVKNLEDKGLSVYPIAGFNKRLEFIKNISPNLVILMSHGRFTTGKEDEVINYFKKQNIPFICPVSIFSDVKEWEKDQRGMSGGILSQGIILPELDGAIAPYVLSAEFKDEKGRTSLKALPRQIDKIATMSKKFTDLQTKKNSEKKIVIIFYQGHGKTALVSEDAGEFDDSLYNTLLRLRKAGYKVENLPKDERGFINTIQDKAVIFGKYAKGRMQDFLDKQNPILIPVEEYEKWVKKDIPDDLYKDVVKRYGDAPGSYLSLEKDGKKYIAMGGMQFGNVTILPLVSAAYSEDTTAVAHGVKQAPPHAYIAQYLWIKYAYKADALMHFGTHGSVEFTPWKQVALSSYDWPNILLGGMPHMYFYSAAAVGEGLIAKRRGYATLISHLAAPFMYSGLSGKLLDIDEKIEALHDIEDPMLIAAYEKSIMNAAAKLNVLADLKIKDVDLKNKKQVNNAIEKMHSYLHQIEGEKVSRGIYVYGRSYSQSEATETALLMAIDSVTFARADLDIAKGKITEKQKFDRHYFDKNYVVQAKEQLRKILNGAKATDFIDKNDLALVSKKSRNPMRGMGMMGMMMSMRGSMNKAKKIKSKTLSRDELNKLILQAANDSDNIKYIKTLENKRRFKRSSSFLDPAVRRKIASIAKMVPAMGRMLKTAGKKEVLALVRAMQNKENYKNVFSIINSNDFIAALSKKEKNNKQKIAMKYLDTAIYKTLLKAINPNYFEQLRTEIKTIKIPELKLKLKEIAKLSKNFKFIIANKGLAKYLANEKDAKAQNVYKILTSSMKSIQVSAKKCGEVNFIAKERFNSYADAVRTILTALKDVNKYRANLLKSTETEMLGMLNGFNGGYLAPSPGGDAIRNPDAVPTGRNLYGIDPNRMPSRESWEVAKKLTQQLIDAKIKKTGKFPKKVAITLWAGEFIRTKGTNIAEALYLLGVTPVWTSRGAVKDVKLIPMDKLKRPRIDVFIQTSGQFRGAATSRIYLLNKAVRLAAKAQDDGEYDNFVKQGTKDSERVMIKNGLSPADARKYSTARVFGGVNGNYGTGSGRVFAGDTWDNDKVLSDNYMKKMGAIYTKDNWAKFVPGAFEGAIQNADTVVHSRSSNTWGPLSLDHVFEFMGGVNMAIRNITGKEPDAYFNDGRNKSNTFVQEAGEAAMVEARSTVLNPKFIKELLEEGPAAAGVITNVIRNSYGWEVMKPTMLKDHLWQEYKEIYVDDKYKLGTQKFFESKNPYALQQITAVMLETIRKGYWKADEKTKRELAEMHAKMVNKFDASCNGFVCNNQKLRKMISDLLKDKKLQKAYQEKVNNVRTASRKKAKKESVKGMELKKVQPKEKKIEDLIKENSVALITIAAIILLLIVSVILGGRKRK